MEDLMQAMFFVARQSSRDRTRMADVVFEFETGDVGLMDLHRRYEVLEMARETVEARLPDIVAAYRRPG